MTLQVIPVPPRGLCPWTCWWACETPVYLIILLQVEVSCKWYVEAELVWSTEGCNTTSTEKESGVRETTCQCDHMTSFAIIMVRLTTPVKHALSIVQNILFPGPISNLYCKKNNLTHTTRAITHGQYPKSGTPRAVPKDGTSSAVPQWRYPNGGTPTPPPPPPRVWRM